MSIAILDLTEQDQMPIYAFMTSNGIWQGISEDGACHYAYRPRQGSNISWLGYMSENTLVSVMCLEWKTKNTVSIHLNILKPFRNMALKIANDFENHLKNDLSVKTIMVEVPECYRNIKLMAYKLGFNKTGLIPSAFHKNRKLHNLNLFTKVIS